MIKIYAETCESNNKILKKRNNNENLLTNKNKMCTHK